MLYTLFFPIIFSACNNRPPPRQCRLCATPVEEIENFVIRSNELDDEFEDLPLQEVFRKLNWPSSEQGTVLATTSNSTGSKKRSNTEELLAREKSRRMSKKNNGTTKGGASDAMKGGACEPPPPENESAEAEQPPPPAEHE